MLMVRLEKAAVGWPRCCSMFVFQPFLFVIVSLMFVVPRSIYAGFNVETVEYKNISFTVWDVGGQVSLNRIFLLGQSLIN